VAMTEWEDHSEGDSACVLHYLAGSDPWRTAKRELWVPIVGAALFLAQISTVGTAIMRALL
jgi:hypothetical protein